MTFSASDSSDSELPSASSVSEESETWQPASCSDGPHTTRGGALAVTCDQSPLSSRGEVGDVKDSDSAWEAWPRGSACGKDPDRVRSGENLPAVMSENIYSRVRKGGLCKSREYNSKAPWCPSTRRSIIRRCSIPGQHDQKVVASHP